MSAMQNLVTFCKTGLSHYQEKNPKGWGKVRLLGTKEPVAGR